MKKLLAIVLTFILLLSIVPFGSMTVSATEVTYYVSSDGDNKNNGKTKDTPVATVAKAIELAATIYGTGDNVTIKLLGETVVMGQMPFYSFDLIVEGSMIANNPTRIDMDYTVIARNQETTTTYRTVELYSDIAYRNFSANGSNVIFEEDVKFNLDFFPTFCYGSYNDGGAKLTIEGQKMIFDCNTLNQRLYIALSAEAWADRTYTDTVELSVNGGYYTLYFNPYFNGKPNGTTKYEDIILNIYQANSIIFSRLDNVTFNGDLYIMNESGIDVTAVEGYADLPYTKYVINNTSGIKDILVPSQEENGKFKVNVDSSMIKVIVTDFKGKTFETEDGYIYIDHYGVYNVSIECIKHSFTHYIRNNDATCNKLETETAKCDNCCKEKDTREIPNSYAQHKYTNYISNNNATCLEFETETAECDYGCGRTDTRESDNKGPHNYEWVIDKNESCGGNGKKHEECTVCNLKRNENTVISATGEHSYTDACDSTCDVCGQSRTAPHNYKWVSNKNATCTEEGTETAICSLCGKVGNTRFEENSAIGHTFDNEEDLNCNICEYERRYVTFFVSSNGNDQNNASTLNSSALTLQGAVQKAIDAGYGSGDFVTVKVVGKTAVGWGEIVSKSANIPAHKFKLIVTSETSGATVGLNTSGVTLGGDTHFKNISVVVSKYPNYYSMYFDGHKVTFDSDVTLAALNVSYLLLGTNSNGGTYDRPINVELNTNFNLFYLSNSYGTRIFNKDINIVVNSHTATPDFYFSGQGSTTFNANVNIDINKAYSIALNTEINPVFGENGALQIINSSGKTISDSKGVLNKIGSSKKFIITNNTGFDILEFTDTKGKYKVSFDTETFTVLAVDASNRKYIATDGYLTVPGGEYTLKIECTNGHMWKDATCTEAKSCEICGETDGEKLGHDWNEVTCTEPKTCQRCGITEGSALGHKFEWIIDKENNCGVDGLKHEECSVCQIKRNEDTVIDATGNHDFDNACDTECDVCGFEREVDHTYASVCDRDCNICGEFRRAPHEYANDCDTDCDLCGVEREVGDHQYSNACDATCNSCGFRRVPSEHIYDNACDKTCNECQAVRSVSDHVYDNNCDALCNVCQAERQVSAHVYSSDCDTMCNECEKVRENTVSHTYTNACDKDCNLCFEVRIPSNHVYGNTCDTDCNVCGFVRTVEHTFTNECDNECDICYETRKPPHLYDNACDTDCNLCGKTRVTEHNWLNATCTEPKTCEYCGLTEGEPSGHDFDSITGICGKCDATSCSVTGEHNYTEVIKKSPECDETGIKEFTCVCGHNYTETIPVLPHNWKPATCTEVKTCTDCGATEGTVIPHNYNAIITKSPTCKEAGTKTLVCSCGAFYDEFIPIISHNWKDATCTEPKSCIVCGTVIGTTSAHRFVNATCTSPKTCSLCGTTEGVALGHTYTEAITKAPACTTAGEKTFTCVCGDKKVEVIAATGTHTLVTTINKATYKANGSIVTKCSVCGVVTGTETIAKLVPKATKISKVTAARKSLKIKIKKEKSVSGYEIQYSLKKNFKSAKKVTLNKNSLTTKTIKKLKAKKIYYVRVRTFKTVNGKKYYSAWSKTVKKKTK